MVFMEHKLSRDEIERIKRGRATLIDVRSSSELAEKACNTALHWDVDQMVAGRFPVINKKQPVFVFCRSGSRSALAQELMTKEGFSDVHNVGGIDDVPDELCN